ncbi:MAG: hypothetical protein HYW37_02395 [Candidatus Colwellbacteria bacterium]|nr:hypothetical protein [Candidatus Colwellbacteria bacterium]
MYYNDDEHFKGTNGYTIDGVWYPRVTSIVNIKAKPALYKYYADLDNFAQGESIKKQSADEGTAVHEAAEAVLIGKEPEVDPSIMPAIEGLKKFLEENNVQVDPDWVEKRIVHFSERYAGTIDSLALIDGKFGVLDIKTSQAIYRDYDLQTAAYFASLLDQFKNLQTRWILRIDQNQVCLKCGATLRIKGGREKIKLPYRNGKKIADDCDHEWSPLRGEVELKEMPYWQDDYAAFLGAKKLWEWENDYWLKKVGYL